MIHYFNNPSKNDCKIRKYSSLFTALQPGFNTFGKNVSQGSVPLWLDFSRSRHLVLLGRCWGFLGSWILPHSSYDRFSWFNFVTLQIFGTDDHTAHQHNMSIRIEVIYPQAQSNYSQSNNLISLVFLQEFFLPELLLCHLTSSGPTLGAKNVAHIFHDLGFS